MLGYIRSIRVSSSWGSIDYNKSPNQLYTDMLLWAMGPDGARRMGEGCATQGHWWGTPLGDGGGARGGLPAPDQSLDFGVLVVCAWPRPGGT